MGQLFLAEALAGTAELSSRPERSVVEGPAVSFPVLTHPLKPWCPCHLLLLKLPNPDIPEADGLALVAMRLELNRSRSIRLVKRLADIQRLALQLEVILHQ